MGEGAEPGAQEVTRLLAAAAAGDAGAWDELLPVVHAELRRLAAERMRGRDGHTLQPTALVNEAYLRLARGDGAFASRAHFLGVAAKAMRSILIDHARRGGAAKRGDGAEREPLRDTIAGPDGPELDVVALDEALARLEALDPELARVVELLFFAGLSAREAAEVLGVASRTVERRWRTARAFLLGELGGADGAA